MWGFKQERASDYSFWSSGPGRRAGVAILANPYGAFRQLKPWGEHYWNEHLIMVTGELEGQRFLLMNVYAPSHGAVRIRFLRQLLEISLPEDHTLVLGGDFNCVLDRTLDRRGGQSKADVGAAELAHFVEARRLLDTGFFNRPATSKRDDLTKYGDRHHTHRHTAASGEVGTSRIDRFYISATQRKLVRGIVTEESPCQADHRAVLLELHSPAGVIRLKKRPKLYPAPEYVKGAMESMIKQELQDLLKEISTPGERPTAQVWQSFKTRHTQHMKHLKKQARARMTRGFRLRIKRLKSRLAQLRYGDEGDAEERAELIGAITGLQDARMASRKRILIARNAWGSKQSTRLFFRRICTKFGDNTIPFLKQQPSGSVRRRQHDKSNIMADSWNDIFNGQAEEKEQIEAYIAGMKADWQQVDLAEVDEAITEEEVAGAISRCKAGKAVGPDDLGNEWYRDHSEELVPILTKIFNDCMDTGTTPESFLEAYIFSISKGGDSSNPLNYRPIALLNTDYKLFTRILAWRVRRHIADLVHATQFGFVPGRTIHEAIDLLEAAKAACRAGGRLTDAQVLLLDFAKAYDSLNRDFLIAVLEAKGFPPRFCRIIRAIHCGTTVQFMVNGAISERKVVTSGIRQGCPLAPLLFILAVDLLYDEIDRSTGVQGIVLAKHGKGLSLTVAGYADDTAIYLQHRSMQDEAIRAVARFSAVSGLRLNVEKSVAIGLGGQEQEMGQDRLTPQQQVQEASSVRYLGHIVGPEDTTEEAWTKAMASLRIRLALAETKTNTVKQRAAIATAIIVPKVLYVARHAWPTEQWIKRIDWSIRHFVWKAVFTTPDTAPAGWINRTVAESAPKKGGLGVPNIRLELKAMSAMVVTDWALTAKTQVHTIGDILQERDIGVTDFIVPAEGRVTHAVAGSLWGTGRPWVCSAMAPDNSGRDARQDSVSTLRRIMRHGNGLCTRWSQAGLLVSLDGAVKVAMESAISTRRGQFGACRPSAVREVGWKALYLCDAQGLQQKKATYSAISSGGAGGRLSHVMTFERLDDGQVIFKPTREIIPMESRHAHLFRELSLVVLANFPELVQPWPAEEVLVVEHGMEDKHHVFEVVRGEEDSIRHTWAAQEHTITWRQEKGAMRTAVAKAIERQPTQVAITPHPWLSRMNPVWVGGRRWVMSRKKYKNLMTKHEAEQAEHTWNKISHTWRKSNAVIGEALQDLEWTKVHTMEAVTAYQTQNIIKLKLGRLRVWTGHERGFRCARAECNRQSDLGPAHLIWGCPDAQAHWKMVRRQWGNDDGRTAGDETREVEVMREIFSFSIQGTQRWIRNWAQEHPDVSGETTREVTEEMWTLCCAETVTAIWRYNVNRVHQEEQLRATLDGAVEALWRGVNEAMARYRSGLYPLTKRSKGRIQVAEEIGRRWRTDRQGESEQRGDTEHSERSGKSTQRQDEVTDAEKSRN